MKISFGFVFVFFVHSISCTKRSQREISTNNWNTDKESGRLFASDLLPDGSGDHHLVGQNDHDHWEASGYGPDDEDGDVIEGSGDSTIRHTVHHQAIDHASTSTDDFIEGSAAPPYLEVPQFQATTTTPTIEPIPESTTTQAVSVTVEEATEESQAEIPTRKTPGTIYDTEKRRSFDPLLRPGILAAVIGGAVVGLLAAILLVMFIVYRMRKKDEGSYALDEPKNPPHYSYAYQRAPTKEFYA